MLASVGVLIYFIHQQTRIFIKQLREKMEYQDMLRHVNDIQKFRIVIKELYSDNVYNIGSIFILHQFAQDLSVYHNTTIFKNELKRMNRNAIRSYSTTP